MNPSEAITHQLLTAITNGDNDLTEGSDFPSEYKLTKQFGRSRECIRNACEPLKQSGILSRKSNHFVIADGAKTIARKLLQGSHVSPVGPNRRDRWGVVIPRLKATPLFVRVVNKLRLYATIHNVELFGWEDSHPIETPADAKKLCRHFVETCNVGGIFFAPFEFLQDAAQQNEGILETLDSVGVILLDRDIYPSPERSKYDLVQMDNFAAGQILAAEVLSLYPEHPHIAFLSKMGSAYSVKLREMGVRQTIATRKGSTCEPIPYRAASEVKAKLEAKTFSAIIACNDDTATLAAEAVKTWTRPPLIASFDGFVNDTQWHTLKQPFDDIARAAYYLMRMRLSENRGQLPTIVLNIPPLTGGRQHVSAHQKRPRSAHEK